VKHIELLAPARDAEVGIEAVNHGADAVYIGAPLFSARAAAGVAVPDIERLAQYAHRYNARTIVALNTILKDEELPRAEEMIHQLWNAGADALIVQDMGLLEMNLPPIPLHASTQMDTRTPEKARLLESLGFRRIVVARELSLQQIRAISEQVSTELECFVHGALCVSVSGQCYMSAYLNGRSANRGTCAQSCRLPMDLYDAAGNLIVSQKHLLSLRDMNRSKYLRQLIEAGISSLKIEGRLKDMTYVKNVTAYYRQLLDSILAGRDDWEPVSDGSCTYTFEPHPEASFNRGFTDYYLEGNLETKNVSGAEPVWNFLTPKSMGERLGKIVRVMRDAFELDTKAVIHNGDGLMVLAKNDPNALDNSLIGFRLNRWDPQRHQIFPLGGTQITRQLRPGMEVWRNQDQAFDQLLMRKSADRKIPVDLRFTVQKDELRLSLTDSRGTEASASWRPEQPFETAQRPQKDNYQRQLTKLGDSAFSARSFHLEAGTEYFIPSSALNSLRRQAVINLEAERERVRCERREEHPAPKKPRVSGREILPADFRANVLNAKARKVFEDLGIENVEPAFEDERRPPLSEASLSRTPVMVTRHCLRYALGACPNFPKPNVSKSALPNGILATPWTLKIADKKFFLKFGCKNECMSEIFIIFAPKI